MNVDNKSMLLSLQLINQSVKIGPIIVSASGLLGGLSEVIYEGSDHRADTLQTPECSLKIAITDVKVDLTLFVF